MKGSRPQVFLSIGWLSASSVRVNDTKIVKIPTHMLTSNIVRNQTHDGNLNIYIPIEKLDIRKLKIVIINMHDVLAKSSPVDQEKKDLHSHRSHNIAVII